MRGVEVGHDLIAHLLESLRDHIGNRLRVNLNPSFYNFGLKINRVGFDQ